MRADERPSPAADTVIVVPCYNEEKRLDVARFESFCANNPDIRLLFVDDGSTDGTRKVLDRLRAVAPGCIDVHPLARNSGKAEAVRAGMRCAFESGAAFAGFWDADLATPLEAIPRFRAIFADRPHVEMVVGSRVRLLGRQVVRDPKRHYLGRMFATVVSTVLGLPIYDTQCGAKLFRATDAVQTLFRDPFLARWIFDVEIIARLIRRYREHGRAVGTPLLPPAQVIYEYPLERWADVAGSKLKSRDFLRAIVDLVRIYRAYLRT